MPMRAILTATGGSDFGAIQHPMSKTETRPVFETSHAVFIEITTISPMAISCFTLDLWIEFLTEFQFS